MGRKLVLKLLLINELLQLKRLLILVDGEHLILFSFVIVVDFCWVSERNICRGSVHDFVYEILGRPILEILRQLVITLKVAVL